MMEYRYMLDVLTEDGAVLDRRVISPDWKAAGAWVHFEGIRRGCLEPTTGPVSPVIEPVWDRDAGEPVVSAFRVRVGSEGGGEVARDIPRTYVRGMVEDVSVALVTSGLLVAGQTFRWAVSAFPAPPDGAGGAAPGDDFGVEDEVQPLPVDDAPLAGFLARSLFTGLDEAAAVHAPVFVPEAVLEEAAAQARRVGDVETGGVLVGKLHRDAHPGEGAPPEVFLEVTAQIPAEHTVSSSAKLTFSADTWAAVHAALTLRSNGESLLGWWHFHPDFCRLRGCPIERRRACDGARPFLSADDVHLHATCFPAGHHVALLVSESSREESLARTLFGWSQGVVAARGFHILGGTTNATNAANAG